MTKDRRWLTWLTPQGVRLLTAERDKILNVKLPAVRQGTSSEVLGRERAIRLLLRRVLQLNQSLHYNGNPATRGIVVKEEDSKQKGVRFNFNDTVKVKLTELGISILRSQHDELNNYVRSRGGKGIGEFELKVDEKGYTSFQFHNLMSRLGPYMTIGQSLPFASSVILIPRIDSHAD